MYLIIQDNALMSLESVTQSKGKGGEEKHKYKVRNKKWIVPVAEAPAGIGWRIPMVPFGRVVFPMVDIRGLVGVEAIMGLMPVGVGTKGCRPVIAVKGERPGVAMERGVNIAWFVPGILGMLGTGPIPRTHTHTHTE